MTFGNKRAYFVDPLPIEISRRIRTEQPQGLEACYSMALDRSRARRLESGGRSSSHHQSGGRGSSRGGDTEGAGRLFARLTAPVTNSNPPGPGPRDLDVVVPRQSSNRGGSPLSTRILPQGSAHPETRCYNCNADGHFSLAIAVDLDTPALPAAHSHASSCRISKVPIRLASPTI